MINSPSFQKFWHVIHPIKDDKHLYNINAPSSSKVSFCFLLGSKRQVKHIHRQGILTLLHWLTDKSLSLFEDILWQFLLSVDILIKVYKPNPFLLLFFLIENTVAMTYSYNKEQLQKDSNNFVTLVKIKAEN